MMRWTSTAVLAGLLCSLCADGAWAKAVKLVCHEGDGLAFPYYHFDFEVTEAGEIERVRSGLGTARKRVSSLIPEEIEISFEVLRPTRSKPLWIFNVHRHTLAFSVLIQDDGGPMGATKPGLRKGKCWLDTDRKF